MAARSMWVIVLAALAAFAPAPAEATADEVRAVLFYSPQCPHCHDVMRAHLPPLLRRYGEALRIVAVNVDTREGQAVYQAVARHFRLPRQRLGVPALVVGDTILVGSWEIPSHLPALVEAGLTGNGVDWPAIPEVRSFLALQGIAAAPAVELTPELATTAAAGGDAVARVLGAAGEARSSVADRFMSDPVANGIAVLALLAMVAVLLLSVRSVYRPLRPFPTWPAWSIPVLAAAGAAIASYMAFVEVSGVEAVCGPVGDCNRVQLSPYAAIAGLPVGVLGAAGYLLLGGLAVAGRARRGESRKLAMLTWGGAVAGVVFSIYLTFLEPFVIGATCMWCINSAVIMTLILVVATSDAARARRGAGSTGLQPGF